MAAGKRKSKNVTKAVESRGAATADETPDGERSGGRNAPLALVTPDPAADPQSARFRQAREARRTELIEDYLELIAELIAEGGEARQVDIAGQLGVAQPTVAKMLKRLSDGGYIQQRPYRGVFLTAEGRRLAEESRQRHEIVEAFLIAIGVDPEIARRDAEGIEHHVSPETLAAFARLTVKRPVRT